jgi:DNA ligase (NAD+)
MANQYSQTRVDDIRRQINFHNHRYYALDDPIISDAEYDTLIRELLDLEEAYPELLTRDSPTQRVGFSPVPGLVEVDHIVPMLSLANAFNQAEFEKWHNRVLRLLEVDHFDMVCELKIDGLSMALTYEAGQLSRGATRGDGMKGEDVTHNIRTIKTVPLTLMNDQHSHLEVRGEVYLHRQDFDRINQERLAEGLPLYANPRNTAAGTTRQLDPRSAAHRNLDIIIWGLGYSDAPDPGTHWASLQQIQDLGFKISSHNRLVKNPEDVESYYRAWVENRESLDYAADGVVVKVNRFDFQEKLGIVGREPRWAIAIKFPAIQSVTRLLNIGINVGRTGSLNPFAILEAVQLGGATVKMATLHNEEDIRRKDIRVGDWVIVERAGEVIPRVIGPVISRRSGNEQIFTMPPNCPVCTTPTTRPEDEAVSRCTNFACPGQQFERIRHFTSAMEIDGLGEKLAIALLQQDLIKDGADVYSLTKTNLVGLDRMAEKSASKVLESIQRSKDRPFSKVLFALGIIHVGLETADILTRHFPSLNRLGSATIDDLTAIPGIGPKIAASIVSFFQSPQTQNFLEKIRSAGLRLSHSVDKNDYGQLLYGKQFVITGRLEIFTRAQAESRIKSLGGSVTSNVTRRTDYLIAGEAAGSKLDQALVLGTPIVRENEFVSLLETGVFLQDR